MKAKSLLALIFAASVLILAACSGPVNQADQTINGKQLQLTKVNEAPIAVKVVIVTMFEIANSAVIKQESFSFGKNAETLIKNFLSTVTRTFITMRRAASWVL